MNIIIPTAILTLGWVAGWVASLVGLRCWLVCVAGWVALLVGLRCWLVCVAGWFALRLGLRFWLVCVTGGRREGEEEDGLAAENENPPTE